MRTRVISSVVLFPLLLFLVIYGGLPLWIAVFVLGLIAQREFYRAFSQGQNRPIHLVGYIFSVIYYLFLKPITQTANLFNIFVSVFLVVILIYVVLSHKANNAQEGIVTFFGLFYTAFLMSHIYLVRAYPVGDFFIWMVFIGAWGCDTGAYLFGRAFGKHKLIPTLSPNKTVEGAVGGVATATLIAVIYGIAGSMIYFGGQAAFNVPLLCGLMGFAGSFLAQLGDLAASAFKRYTGIKDYGKLIPGHGGALDRFDSVLLTAPAVYYLMVLMTRLG